MAHVIHSINMTASASCHHLDSVVDNEHQQYAIDLTQSADALILGRNTFDLFTEFWPGAVTQRDLPAPTVQLAEAFNRIPKLVVSSRPVESTWKNTRPIQGPSLDGIKAALGRLDGTAVVFGSPGLASSLLNAGLIDELHILFQPLVGVDGPRAFRELNRRAELSLLSVDPFQSGAVLIRYTLA